MYVNESSFHMIREGLLELFSEVPLCRDVDDGYDLMMASEGDFTVPSCYELFSTGAAAGTICQEDTSNAFVSLWKVEAPPKLLILAGEFYLIE